MCSTRKRRGRDWAARATEQQEMHKANSFTPINNERTLLVNSLKMKRIIASTLIILTIGSTFILYKEKAQAQANCWTPSKDDDPANHSEAYSDGYRQGVESAQKREKYRPRVVGGEFARGFKEGYDDSPYNNLNSTVTRTLDSRCYQLLNSSESERQRKFENGQTEFEKMNERIFREIRERERDRRKK